MRAAAVTAVASVLTLSIVFVAYSFLPFEAAEKSAEAGCEVLGNGAGKVLNDVKCADADFPAMIQRFKKENAQQNRKIKVLVTGAGGFIGSHVADYCLNQMEFDVVAIDDLSGGFMRNLEEFSQSGGTVEIGDIQDAKWVKRLFEKYGPFDFVYHLAAYAAEGLSHFIRNYNYNNNLIGSINLLNAAIDQRPIVRAFVFTSSIAAYGASNGVLPLTETSPKHPEDPYGIAKMAFELDLQAAHDMFGINYIIFRPHNVYGPRQNIADKFRNAIGIFMNQILQGHSITIFGDGTQSRGFSYISDVADILAASVAFPNAYNNDFFVGNDQPHTLNQLAEAVSVSMDAEHKVVHIDARKEVKHAFASHEKMVCAFRPPPTVPLSEGLARTAAFVKRHGAFEPTGYTKIELRDKLPSSWVEWLAAQNHSMVPTQEIKEAETSVVRCDNQPGPIKQSMKEKTRVVVFIPTAVAWASRRIPVQKRFLQESWKRSEAVMVFVFGSRTGPRLEQEIDTSSVAQEGLEYVITPCRDLGDEYNNANGTSSTTCKIYEGVKHVYNHFEAEYVWRGSDDAYLNLKLFFSMVPTLPRTGLYLGRIRIPLNALFGNEDMKLYHQPELQKIFGLYMFGQHMGGSGYVLSWDVVAHMATWVIPPHQTWVEDVIVGMWLNPFQIAKVDMKDLILNRDEYIQFVNDNSIPGKQILNLHYVKDEDWANIDDEGMFHPKGWKKLQ